MAGGTFKEGVNAVRPGVYINMKSGKAESYSGSNAGTVVLPLVNHNYGPTGFVQVDVADLSLTKSIIGYDIEKDNSDSLLPLKEALKNARYVYAYILTEGEKATATIGNITATAKFGGSRGNDFKIVISANVANSNAFDVYVYIGTTLVERFNEVKSSAELVALTSNYVVFSGEGDITATAGISLAGGTDKAATNEDFTKFLDECEQIVFDAAAFPVTDVSLKEAAKTKIKYMNDNMGKYVVGFAANCSADSYTMVNVTNGVVLEDETKVSAEVATAYAAGARAKAGYTSSLTGKEYIGAVSIIGKKTHEASENALKNGEFFFSFDDEGNVCIESDINSLVTITDDIDKTYRKNKIIAIAFGIFKSIKSTYKASEYPNIEDGWKAMEGAGAAVLLEFQKKNVIKAVDTSADCVVDTSKSTDDETYITIGFSPVDSAEKIYITALTR